MDKVWTWLGSGSLLIACGGSGAAPIAPGAVHPAAAAPIAALNDARHWRAEADAIAVPSVPSITDQADSLAFLKGPVKDWVMQKRRAVEQADAAYSEAFSRLNDAELAIAQGEVGDLWGSFAGTFVELGVASIPPKIKGDATLRLAYTQAIEESAAPQRDRARGAYQTCSSKADHRATAAHCEQKLAELSRTASPAPAPVVMLAKPNVSSPERPWLPTRQPTPCSFAGSLRLGRAPVSALRDSEPLAWLELLELSKLELPAKRGEPLRLTSDWPVRATFYLSAAQLPLVLRERLELAPEHVWLGAGAAVSAAAASGKSALVYRHFRGATPDPARVVPCAQLDLASAAPPAEPSGATKNFVGELQLFASPSGKEVARFTLHNPESLEVLETQAAWRHVAARQTAQRIGGKELPYDFDGWTQLSPTNQQSFGMIGLMISNAEPTHVVTRDLELFTAPKATSKLGELVKDVAVLVGETRDGFVNVDVPGLIRAGKDWGFWVKADAFQSSVRQL